MFNWYVTFASFSPYILLSRHKLEMLTSIQENIKTIMKFDDLNLWLQTCEQQTILFWHVILVDMENMTSVHDHQDMLHYAIICGVHGYRPQVHRFELGDYVYL
jgi:hypothetical protein